MSVKADSKGRLTGATPEEEYTRTETADGVITYTPKVTRTFDQEREITEDQFEAFFGCTIKEVSVDGLKAVLRPPSRPGQYPGAFVFQRFILDEDGKRTYSGSGKRINNNDLSALKEDVIIRIFARDGVLR